MFAITKQQKIRKLLIKQYKLSLNLETEIKFLKSNYNFEDTYTSGSEIKLLEIEDLQLRLEKLSILFDSLKSTYNGFEICDFSKDKWKLDKPVSSEGTLFVISKNEYSKADDIPSPINLFISITSYVSSDVRMADHNLMTSLLSDAMDIIIRAELFSMAVKLFNKYPQFDDTEMRNAYLLYKIVPKMSNSVTVLDIGVPIELVAVIAKITHTNIIFIQKGK